MLYICISRKEKVFLVPITKKLLISRLNTLYALQYFREEPGDEASMCKCELQNRGVIAKLFRNF